MTYPIEFQPLGGLGNQLFVYGTALRLSLETGLQIAVDKKKLHNYNWHNYELDSFQNSIVAERNSYHLGPPVLKGALLLRKLGLPVREPQTQQFEVGDPIANEKVPEEAKRALEKSGRVVLSGYFQDYSVIKPAIPRLRDETAKVKNPTRWYRRMRERLQKTDFLAIHVRLGNFSWVPEHNVVGNDYYEDAIDWAKAVWPQLKKTFVFSDEPELAREFPAFKDVPESNFICEPEDESSRPIESVNLLRQASGMVLGNSTFSLWSAYLNERVGDRVIAPRPFSKLALHDERFLLKPKWLSIGY